MMKRILRDTIINKVVFFCKLNFIRKLVKKVKEKSHKQQHKVEKNNKDTEPTIVS
jgi:hypothetical protein